MRVLVKVLALCFLLELTIRAPGIAEAPKERSSNQQNSSTAIDTELQRIESAAASFDPSMRTFLLWQIGEARLKTGNPQKGQEVLEMAFAASLSDSLPKSLRDELQDHVLGTLFPVAPSKAEELAMSAEAQTRRAMIELVVDKHIADRKLKSAGDTIADASRVGPFPYKAAVRLMMAFPKSASDERRALFAAAVSNYEHFEDSAGIDFEDLGTMVVRFWQTLPPKLVLQAIDTMLERARIAQEKSGATNTITLAAGEKAVAFDSPYEYRLFQLIPVLRQLDSGRAEGLLRNRFAVSDTLKLYPNGIQSIDSALSSSTIKDGRRETTAFAVGQSDAATQQATAAIESQQRQIASEMKRDLRAALAATAALPLFRPDMPEVSPRADMLLHIARVASTKNPDLARDALDKLRELRERVRPWAFAHLARSMSDCYLKLGDSDAATKVLTDTLPLALALYREDNDNDHPNLALKANWPSAFIWNELVLASRTVSEDAYQEVLQGIGDVEIRTLVELRQVAADSKIVLPIAPIEWKHDTSK